MHQKTERLQALRSIPPFHTLFFLAGCSILVCSASAARHTGLWYGTVGRWKQKRDTQLDHL